MIYFLYPFASPILLVIIITGVIKDNCNWIEDILVMSFSKYLIAQNWSQLLTLLPAGCSHESVSLGFSRCSTLWGSNCYCLYGNSLQYCFCRAVLTHSSFHDLKHFRNVAKVLRIVRITVLCPLPPNNLISMRAVHSVSRHCLQRSLSFADFGTYFKLWVWRNYLLLEKNSCRWAFLLAVL